LFRRIVTYAVLLGIAGFLLGGITLAIMLAWVSKDLPDPSRLIDRTIAQTTKIYDRSGEVLLYEIHGQEKRTQLALEEITPYAKWAAIAIEDKNFSSKGCLISLFLFVSLKRFL